MDIERKAQELLAHECPECGGEDGHETEEGWLRCGRCSDPHSVTRHQAMQAIIAALTPPEGYVLVPRVPTGTMLMAGGDVEEIHVEYGVDPYVENPEAIWDAMIAARPEVP
jgi:hypothetical protein